MSPAARPPEHIINDIARLAKELNRTILPDALSEREKLRKRLRKEVALLDETVGQMDPVLKPLRLFDPTHPDTSARVTALTMATQPEHPLAAIRPFYGAGVYALYYRGDFKPYSGLTRTEQPIYVGKADPAAPDAATPEEQGIKLYDRLVEHRETIDKAANLEVRDFYCRFLVVKSGYQKTAEDKLIRFFLPIWNYAGGFRICYGMSKHGDNPKIRQNKRSPWHTLHPGAKWAKDIVEDQKTEEQIIEEIANHLEKYPPKSAVNDIVDAFVAELRQMDVSVFQDGRGDLRDVEAPVTDTSASDLAALQGILSLETGEGGIPAAKDAP